jgi:N6-adenosine-specific RNA methylase IME4/DNA-directed RNA polymerase subunit K/omega
MTELVAYDEARRALQIASTVDEAKNILDKAEALRHYARQRDDVELECWVSEIKARAYIRIGEISRELEKAPSGKASHSLPSAGKSKSATLRDAGISTSTAHRAEQLAAHAPLVERYIAEKASQHKPVKITDILAAVAKHAKQERPRARLYEMGREYCTTEDLLSLTGQEFGTIYADPPWDYGNQSTRGANNDHYLGMTVDEICALPIGPLAAKDAHLHLWTTNGFLFDAQRVLQAWGFTYKSCYVWVKPQIGMGNYWRVSHEFLLLGVRGNLTFSDKTLRSWGQFKRGKHSAKPEQIRDLIQKASPGPRLELFARRPVEGWTCWGNEIKRDKMGQLTVFGT